MEEAIDPILNPTVFIGAFEWREPVTTLTDFLVALVCWYAFYRLQTYRGSKPVNFNFYKIYFLCFAIGMTSAAWFGHGLQAYVGPRMKAIGWLMSATGLLMLGLASLLQIRSRIPSYLYQGLRIWLPLQYLIVAFLMIHPTYSNFVIAQLNSTLMLIFWILPMQFYHYWTSGSWGSKVVAGAISYGILPGIVYTSQFSIHRWYNYHDISHTLMAIFMTLMFIGIYNIIREHSDSSSSPVAEQELSATA